MAVLYCVTERMPDGYTLVENARVIGEGDQLEVHFGMEDIRLRAEDKSRAFDFMSVGIIKSILELSNDMTTLYVICSQKLFHEISGLGENDFRSVNK